MVQKDKLDSSCDFANVSKPFDMGPLTPLVMCSRYQCVNCYDGMHCKCKSITITDNGCANYLMVRKG